MKPFMFGYHEIYFETFHIGYNGIHVLMLSGHYVRIMQQRNSPVQPKKKKKGNPHSLRYQPIVIQHTQEIQTISNEHTGIA